MLTVGGRGWNPDELLDDLRLEGGMMACYKPYFPKGRFVVRYIFVSALLALAAFVGVLPSSHADAYCFGSSEGTYYVVAWAKESVGYSPTCNSDFQYSGKLTDTLTDGYPVSAQYINQDRYHYTSYTTIAQTSSVASAVNYGVYDDNSNSTLKLCRLSSPMICTATKYNSGY